MVSANLSVRCLNVVWFGEINTKKVGFSMTDVFLFTSDKIPMLFSL